MSALELKTNIHKMVEGIENENVLQSLFDFLSVKKGQENSNFWKSLNSGQKQEILLAFDESESTDNLMDKETFLSSF